MLIILQKNNKDEKSLKKPEVSDLNTVFKVSNTNHAVTVPERVLSHVVLLSQLLFSFLEFVNNYIARYMIVRATVIWGMYIYYYTVGSCMWSSS